MFVDQTPFRIMNTLFSLLGTEGHKRRKALRTQHRALRVRCLGELTRPDFQVVRTLDEAYRLLRVESPELGPIEAPE